MTERKKWARNWDQVKYCSERCRKAKADAFEQDLLALLIQRGFDKTICPSEILSAPMKKDKDTMEAVRRAARRLAALGVIQILQKGQAVDPSSFKGPIRLKLNRNS